MAPIVRSDPAPCAASSRCSTTRCGVTALINAKAARPAIVQVEERPPPRLGDHPQRRRPAPPGSVGRRQPETHPPPAQCVCTRTGTGCVAGHIARSPAPRATPRSSAFASRRRSCGTPHSSVGIIASATRMGVPLMLQPVPDQLRDRHHLHVVQLGRTRPGPATRAIVPSSFMISQITPAGASPAIRARSTDASVCPARTRTPPLRARSGKTCPWPRQVVGGRPRDSIATRMVCARSAAEIPVVTPWRASTLGVKRRPEPRRVLTSSWAPGAGSRRAPPSGSGRSTPAQTAP